MMTLSVVTVPIIWMVKMEMTLSLQIVTLILLMVVLVTIPFVLRIMQMM